MKKTLLFLFGLFFTVLSASANGGWADCAVNVSKDGSEGYLYSLGNENWADGIWLLNTVFDAYDFGTPTSLVLNGGIGNAWTDDTPGYNSTSFVLYYRVYKNGTTPGGWSQIALDNLNPKNGNNYIYDKTNAGIDVLALATDAGTYILEVAMSKNQFYPGGNLISMIPGNQNTAYSSAVAGYKATFTKTVTAPTVTGISPSSGTTAGGTSVVITGTNFTGATTVNFGGTAGSITANTATSITAVSPAGTGTVDITVTTAGGTSATSNADQFTYIITNISVPATAGGLSAAITAAGGDLATVTSLTVTGTIDARDFKTMRDNMPHLATLDLSGATIVAYTGTGGTGGTTSITYPANGIPQNAFGTTAIGGNTILKSIPMPASVTSIGDDAFFACGGLTGPLTIPSTVTSIGKCAFLGCRGFTGSLKIPSSVTYIGDTAFGSCDGFTGSLTIPSSVTSIGGGVFKGCSGFTGSLTIPSSVTSIGDGAFSGCSGFTGSLTIPSSVTSIGFAAFNCSNISSIKASGTTPGSITLGPAVFSGMNTSTCVLNVPVGTKALYAAADQWKDFTNIIESPVAVTTPGTLGTILTSDQLSNLTSLTVTGTIDARDFKTMRDNMPHLATLDLSGATIATHTGTDGTVSANVTYPANEIPQYSFYNTTISTVNTSLTSISLPSSVTSIGNNAFQDCSSLAGSLTIPSTLTTIGNNAFYGCGSLVGSLTIPSTLTTIGNNAFTNSGVLFTVDGANPNYSSEDNVLFNKDKTILIQCPISKTGSYTIPSSVTSIGESAFYNCSSITGSLTIPSLVTSIGTGAFVNCIGFTGSLTIPASITSIGDYAFYGCSNISSIKAYGATPSLIRLGSSAFVGMNTSTCVLHVPAGTKDLYEAADQWKAFKPNITDDLVIAPAVTSTVASSVTSSGAILNGTINPNNASTAVMFEYGTSTSYGTSVTALQSPVTGKTTIAVSYTLTGLTPNTTYHYRVIGVNSEGTTNGADQTFTTAAVPTISGISPTSGSTVGGTSVTITGTGFTDATAVKFGSANATGFTVNSATQITATAPARSAGVVDITVITAGGTSATSSADQFTYVAPPTANNALNFDGTNDVVRISPFPTANGTISFTAWVKLNTTTGYQSFGSWAYPSSNLLIRTSSGNLELIFNNQLISGGAIPAGSWQHIAFTKTGFTFNLYVNGVLKSSGNLGATDQSFTAFQLGSLNGTMHYLNGEMDDVAVWNKVLTETEIQSISSAPLTGNESNLLACYNFDNGASGGNNAGLTTLEDVSPNSYNGTLNNFTLTGTTSNWVKSTVFTPSVSTQAVSSIATTTATGNGNITKLGIDNPTQYGVVWSKSTNPTVALTTKTAQGTIAATGAFTSSITGLESNTTYYVKAYATNTAGTSYGSEVSFTTLPVAPTITAISPTAGSTVGGTTVTITGTNLTGVTAVKFGSTNATGFTVNSATQITATAPARSVGTVDITVTTAGVTSASSSADQFTYVAAPAATTNAATSISSTGATLAGSINAKNASTTVTFEYGLTTSYGTTVTADQSPVTGSVATPVSKAITGLAAGVTYHYRVVGVNAGGRTNGLDKSFTTPLFAGNGTPEDPYPIATLADLKWVSEHSDIWNGSFVQTADIDASTTSTWNAGKGFSPIGDVTTKFTGSYNGQYHTITGLTINRPGGNDYNIGLFGVTSSATLKNIGLPDCSIRGGYNVGSLVGYMGYNSTITSSISDCYCTGEVSGIDCVGGLVGFNHISSITNSYSTCYVNAISDAAGLVGKKINLTITNCFYDKNTSGQSDNSGKGTPKTTAEMKGQNTFTGWDFVGETANGSADIWAISSTLNNGYPCFMSQITSPTAPTVTTQAVTAIATTTATGNGDITGLGVPNPGSHGICWGTSANPTIIDNTVVNKGVVSATGAFSAPMTGLTPNTLYHVRAYATNSIGTSYGADVSFISSHIVPDAPTAVSATGGNGQAIVSFTAPTSNGGTSITGYTVTSNPGGLTGAGTESPIVVTGLTNGTAYTFTVTATNSAGASAASAASGSVTPIGTQTITFANPGTQNFGTTPQLSATTASGLKVIFSTTTPDVCSITSEGTLTFLKTGTCTIFADQAGNTAYSAAPTVSQTFTVNALPVTITVNADQTKVYGESDAPFTYSVSPALKAGDSFTGALAREAGENVGRYAINQGTLSAGDNYAISFVGDNFNITAKPITVTVGASQSKVYGESDPSFTYSVSPVLKAGDAFTGSLAREGGESVGRYAINQGTLSAGDNYAISFVGNKFSITAKPITVTADGGQTKMAGAAEPAFTYSVHPALVSGDAFTGALAREAGETVATYAIHQGTLSAGANYSVTFVGSSFSITPSFFTISGNAGIAGATLSYFDGTSKMAVAAADGSYSITVPAYWSGTVTASLAGYDFSANKVYTNVSANLSGENYTATDILAPTMLLTYSSDKEAVKAGDVITFTATFSDANGISESPSPTITIGSVVVNAAMNKTSNLVWTYTWTVPANVDATVAISVTATDPGGNRVTGGLDIRSYVIDNTPPAAIVTNISSQSTVHVLDNTVIGFSEQVVQVEPDLSNAIIFREGGKNGVDLPFAVSSSKHKSSRANVMGLKTAAAGITQIEATVALKCNTTYYLALKAGTFADMAGNLLPLYETTFNTDPNPAKPVIAGAKVTVCAGDVLTCSNADASLAYIWQKDGKDISGASGTAYTLPDNAAGAYSLKVTDNVTSCASVSDVATIAEYPAVTPVVYEKKQPGVISILVVDNTSNAFTSYQWTYADGSALPSGMAAANQFLVLNPENMNAAYKVTTTDNNGCKRLSASKSVTVKSASVVVYPTVSSQRFTVNYADAKKGNAMIRVVNSRGEVIQTLSVAKNSMVETYDLNLGYVPAGVYYIELQMGGFKDTKRVIISK